MSDPNFIVIDGSGHRYKVANYLARFLLISEEDGHRVTVDSATLRQLGIEWDGKELQPVGGREGAEV